jgi:hypothetical protein
MLTVFGIQVTWGGFIVGLFVGGSMGVVVMCLCSMAGQTSRETEEFERKASLGGTEAAEATDVLP